VARAAGRSRQDAAAHAHRRGSGHARLGKKTFKSVRGTGQSWILSERAAMSARFRCRSG
jgi:hypothetical protein